MDVSVILGDIVILLTGCLLLGGLFSRFGQSPLLGYLLSGMMLGGPGSIQAVRSEYEIQAIAELGVALLLFSLGLEFSLKRLSRLGAKPAIGGVIQVVITTVLGAAGGLVFGLTLKQSVAVGAMISLSSTAVVLRMLTERSELESPHGRNSLAVLLVQDVAVVPLALFMTVLAGEGGAVDVALNVGKLALLAAALIVGILVFNLIAVRALGTLTLQRNRELTVIFAVVTGLGTAWAAHAAGISPALGAFVAGAFLGSSPFATQVRADISSLRTVLLTLFFGAAGMVADPIWIFNHWRLVAAVTLLLVAGKTVLIWGIFQLLGHTTRVAAATGMALAQSGEFAFVLGSAGLAGGVITQELYAMVISVTIVSFFLSSFLVPLAPRFGNRAASLFRSTPVSASRTASVEPSPDVIVIGFGPAGRAAARPLIDRGKRVTVIDLNHSGVKMAQEFGFRGEVGDATQVTVLEHAQLSQAKAVVISIPFLDAGICVLEHVRRLAPHAHIIVRSRYERYTADFATAGAHVVVGDEEEVGQSLARCLVEWLESSEDRNVV